MVLWCHPPLSPSQLPSFVGVISDRIEPPRHGTAHACGSQMVSPSSVNVSFVAQVHTSGSHSIGRATHLKPSNFSPLTCPKTHPQLTLDQCLVLKVEETQRQAGLADLKASDCTEERLLGIFDTKHTALRATGWARVTTIIDNRAAQVRYMKTHVHNTCARLSLVLHTKLRDPNTQSTVPTPPTNLLNPPAQLTPLTVTR